MKTTNTAQKHSCRIMENTIGTKRLKDSDIRQNSTLLGQSSEAKNILSELEKTLDVTVAYYGVW